MPKKINDKQKVDRLQDSLAALLGFLNDYPHQFGVNISGLLDNAYEALKETGYKIDHERGTPFWMFRGGRKPK